MGDSYRPSGRYDDRDRFDERDSYDYGRRQYANSRPSRRDEYEQQQRDSGSFTFRGAADSSRPRYPQEDFSFRAGSFAPSFPQEMPRPREPRNQQYNSRNKNRSRGGRQQGGPRQFRPRPAHERDLLKRNDRESTPEQLAGMNGDTQPRFAEYISSDSEEEDESSEDTSEEEEGDGAPRKRTKISDTHLTAQPKWSNPDPYSVLPPIDVGLAPKKDIVQVIRKSKLDAAAKRNDTNAIKENIDFISFDDADPQQGQEEEQEDDDADNAEDGELTKSALDSGSLSVLPSDEDIIASYLGTSQGNAQTNDQIGQDNARGKKRKRADNSASGIVHKWLPRFGDDPSPWHRPGQYQASRELDRLHQEILDFHNYMRPYPHEADLRNDLIDRVEAAIRRGGVPYSRNIELRSFGSFAAGLYLPVSDMDLVAVSPEFMQTGAKRFGQRASEIRTIGHHLGRSGICAPQTMVPIVKAKVPIIKFVDQLTGIKVDISMENDSGLYANRTFRQWKEEFPQMPSLVMVIKQFLAMRDLNEVQYGGIGGFSIICLVVSMLQHIPTAERESKSYAALLLEFFDLYGNKFDHIRTGIIMNPPGYFEKQQNPTRAKINPERLTIIDPNRPENDIAGGSKEINRIRKCFRDAHSALQQSLDRGRTNTEDSILGCILGGNYSSFDDARARLDRLDRSEQKRLRGPPPPTSRSMPAGHDNAPMQGYNSVPPPASHFQAFNHPNSSRGAPQHYPKYSQSATAAPPPVFDPSFNASSGPQSFSFPKSGHPLPQRPMPADFPPAPPTHDDFLRDLPPAPKHPASTKSKKAKLTPQEKKQKRELKAARKQKQKQKAQAAPATQAAPAAQTGIMQEHDEEQKVKKKGKKLKDKKQKRKARKAKEANGLKQAQQAQ